MATLDQDTKNFNIERYSSSLRRKSYAVGFVTTLFILVVVVFGILPTASAILNQYSDNKKRDEVISKLDKKLKELNDLKAEQGVKSELYQKFDNQILPSNESNEFVIETVNKIADANGIIVRRMEFADAFRNDSIISDVKVNSKLKSKNIFGNFEGSYQNLAIFLRELESADVILNVSQVSVTKSSDKYEMRVTLEYFYYN